VLTGSEIRQKIHFNLGVIASRLSNSEEANIHFEVSTDLLTQNKNMSSKLKKEHLLKCYELMGHESMNTDIQRACDLFEKASWECKSMHPDSKQLAECYLNQAKAC